MVGIPIVCRAEERSLASTCSRKSGRGDENRIVVGEPTLVRLTTINSVVNPGIRAVFAC